MGRAISRGTCNLCHATFSKAAMTKHVMACIQRTTVSTPSSGKRSPQKTPVIHLVLEGRHLPMYWMHLEIHADATLGQLDGFLRHTWLECCGHLSAFTIQGESYSSGPEEMIDDEGMGITLREVLKPGTKFYHEYDFGTTTELTLKVVAEREGERRGKPIQLLARNDPPVIPCGECGKSATHVCSQCSYEAEGWLCDRCADEHKCGEEMFLPVVNSPRVGMCGYEG